MRDRRGRLAHLLIEPVNCLRDAGVDDRADVLLIDAETKR